MDETNGRSSYTERLFAVLEALVDAGEPIGPRPLARISGVDRNAVSRILQHLSEIGIVERSDGVYAPAARFFSLCRAGTHADTFTNAAQPILDRLTHEFDESSYVCRRAGDVAFMTHKSESERPVRYVIRMNTPFPLYAGSAGRAILSGLPAGEVDSYLARIDPSPITERTPTDTDVIRERVAEARALGYCFAAGEVVEDGWAVSSPYFDDHARCVGAIVLSSPMSRIVDDVKPIGHAVRDAAAELSARLGFRAE